MGPEPVLLRSGPREFFVMQFMHATFNSGRIAFVNTLRLESNLMHVTAVTCCEQLLVSVIVLMSYLVCCNQTVAQMHYQSS